MGWTFQYGQSKADLVKERMESFCSDKGARLTCIKHSLRGNHLWKVWERTHPTEGVTRFIGLDLLQKNNGEWGYKDMSESCHPYYFDCPLSFLDMVPVACEAWRKGVREWHNRQAMLKNLSHGDYVTSCGWTFKVVAMPKGKSLLVFGACGDGIDRLYNLPKSRVERVVANMESAA